MAHTTLSVPVGQWCPCEVVREDLIAEVREAIDAGRYVTMDKIDVAVERLFAELTGPEAPHELRVPADSRLSLSSA